MRILVCVKQVPDTTEVKLSSEYTLQRDFVAQVMNPADESALEKALALRDQHGGTVTVMTMGPARAESMLREAITRGADEAIHLTDSAFAGADTLVTAKCLQAAAEMGEGFDLILCGRRAVDGETGQVGPMVAALLDVPCVPNATDVRLENNALVIDQLTEAGVITWQAYFPAVITFCEWSHHLRLPTLMGMRRARNAQIRRVTAQELGIKETGLKASPTRVVRIHSRPAGVRPCQKLPVDEVLAALVHKEVLP